MSQSIPFWSLNHRGIAVYWKAKLLNKEIMDKLKSTQLHILSVCMCTPRVCSTGPSYSDLTPTLSPAVLSHSQKPLQCTAQGIFACPIFGADCFHLGITQCNLARTAKLHGGPVSLLKYSQSRISSVKLYTYRAMTELLQGNINC